MVGNSHYLYKYCVCIYILLLYIYSKLILLLVFNRQSYDHIAPRSWTFLFFFTYIQSEQISLYRPKSIEITSPIPLSFFRPCSIPTLFLPHPPFLPYNSYNGIFSFHFVITSLILNQVKTSTQSKQKTTPMQLSGVQSGL